MQNITNSLFTEMRNESCRTIRTSIIAFHAEQERNPVFIAVPADFYVSRSVVACADKGAQFVRNEATARAHNVAIRKSFACAFFPKDDIGVSEHLYIVYLDAADEITYIKRERDFAFYAYIRDESRQRHNAERHVNASYIKPLRCSLESSEHRLFVLNERERRW